MNKKKKSINIPPEVLDILKEFVTYTHDTTGMLNRYAWTQGAEYDDSRGRALCKRAIKIIES